MHKFTQIAVALLIGASMSLTAVAAASRTPSKPQTPRTQASNSNKAPNKAPEKAFVKVNGVPISQNFADAFIAEQKARGAQDSPELQVAAREELIRRELLVQQAKKANLDKRPEVAAQAEAAKQLVLIRSYVQQFFQENPVKDEQLQAEYEKIKAQVGSTEYKTRHILVKEEAEAQTIIDELKDDVAKFDELAKQSLDPGSKDKGGDLGWAGAGNYVKPFADALTALEKGKFTETPVKSQFGYHVILLEDTRPTTFPSFDEIKPRLLQQAQQQQITRMVEDLRAQAKIEE
ncbi:MAG: peptidylprolyl isomerase [Candidatus Accumulibacter sp.]|jgi:peptidyl-prolyl cis-trans isomerase C|nr:peptidylprolyl isomerase [Accumulibacter sp.]